MTEERQIKRPSAKVYRPVKLALCLQDKDFNDNFFNCDTVDALDDVPLYFIDRALCDHPNGFLQLVIHTSLVQNNSELLVYRHLDTAEPYNAGKLSCGFGGRIESIEAYQSAMGAMRTLVYREIARELQKQVGIPFTTTLTQLAFNTAPWGWSRCYDASVGPVAQLAIRIKVDVTGLDLNFNQSEISSPRWIPFTELEQYQPDMVNWSQNVVHNILRDLQSKEQAA